MKIHFVFLIFFNFFANVSLTSAVKQEVWSPPRTCIPDPLPRMSAPYPSSVSPWTCLSRPSLYHVRLSTLSWPSVAFCTLSRSYYSCSLGTCLSFCASWFQFSWLGGKIRNQSPCLAAGRESGYDERIAARQLDFLVWIRPGGGSRRQTVAGFGALMGSLG